MTENIQWSEAEAAVGSDGTDDYILRPEKHAADLPARAGALKRVLERNSVRHVMDRYKRFDQEAVLHQKRYRKARPWLVRCAIAAAVTGLFALSLHLILGYQAHVQLAVVVLHCLLMVAVIAIALWLERAGPRRKWHQARGRAELWRGAYFNEIAKAEEPADAKSEIPLLPLQLAYFRRYQLDMQLSFFEKRGQELARSTGRAGTVVEWPSFTLACATLGLAALVIAAIGLLHLAEESGLEMFGAITPGVDPQVLERFAHWVFLALAASTIYAFLMTNQDASEESRNSRRYLALNRNLKFLKANAYERVRLAAEAGDRGKVERFVALIQEQMLAEQKEWLSLEDIVGTDDQILAAGTATGLIELFDDRFKGDRPGAPAPMDRPQ